MEAHIEWCRDARRRGLKGVLWFLSIFNRHVMPIDHRDCQYVLVGNASNYVKSHIYESIEWLGPQDEGRLPGLYRNARAVLYPSRYEGFGLPVLEAIRDSGIPMGLLSNTNPAHWAWILRQNYPVVEGWFDPIILSYEVKAMKPARSIPLV